MNPRNRLATPYSCGALLSPQNPETSRHRDRGTWLFTLAVWAGLAVGLNGPPARATGLRAGVARIDITPTQPVMLAGYASRKDLSRGMHDPLSARALAFEQNGQRLVLVSIDNLGQAIKTASPFRSTFIFTHCNGAAGYVPTRASYAEGGYEVQSSPFAPGAGEQLIEAALQGLRDLQ